MSAPLIAITGLIYLYVAGECFFKGDRPMALVFAAYAVANAGLIWAMRR
jgi:hypothetical protein